VGIAILNTSITIVFGFSILVLSNFIPTIYFGVFTGIAMLLAMISVLTLLPKLQPVVSDYVESEFINNVGLGVVIFIFTLFLTIVVGKSLGRAVTWTGVGSIDKAFGILFGFFKGYVVSVCLFSVFNWFYPYQNWGISAEDAISFKLINKGSEILIEEFPSSDDFIDTKEKIEKI
jgi:membrane protein required for colicin V production